MNGRGPCEPSLRYVTSLQKRKKKTKHWGSSGKISVVSLCDLVKIHQNEIITLDRYHQGIFFSSIFLLFMFLLIFFLLWIFILNSFILHVSSSFFQIYPRCPMFFREVAVQHIPHCDMTYPKYVIVWLTRHPGPFVAQKDLPSAAKSIKGFRASFGSFVLARRPIPW